MNRTGSVLLVVVFALVGLIAGAVTAGLLLGRPSTGAVAGPTHSELQYFVGGARFGAETNTSISGRNCTSLSNYNFPSVASVSSTVTGFSMSGQAVADLCEVSLSSDTSTVAHILSCNFPTTASTTVTLFNGDIAALDLSTGTLKVCYVN